MDTKSSIQTRDITAYVELTECDQEKVHLIGNIQGEAGNVLFVKYPEGRIVGADMKVGSIPWIDNTAIVSQNPPKRARRGSLTTRAASPSSIPSLTGSSGDRSSAHGMLGSFLSDCFPNNLYTELMGTLKDMLKSKSKRSFSFFNHSSGSYAISLSPTQEDFSVIGIEIERVDKAEVPGEFCQTLISLSRIMENYADEEIVKTTCDTVFNLLGKYDRGMVYRFNDDLSGEVIHEIKGSHVDSSYQGMRFPAGDIPLPARKLFLTNGLRYIHNVNAEDIPIIHEASEKTMDLSHIRMRAVSIHHIRYLQNMGVVSSMSIAVVVDNELWGLLSFHGYQDPFKPSLQQRIAIETIASMLSVKMEALVKKTQSNSIIKLSEVLMNWDHDHSVTYNMKELGRKILGVVDADVLVTRIKNPSNDETETVITGDESLAPEQQFWDELSKHPKREMITLTTHAGMAKLGLTEENCKASGIVYYRDGLIQIMFGRGLRSKDVVWGGNPDAPKVRKDGFLCPRNSFDQFMEKARKESRAWSKSDLHLISSFVERVSEHSHNRMVSLLKNDIEEANHKYFNAIERARDNCDFFAQMSHEIRTPFHGVMGCLNILHDAKNMSDEDIQDMVTTALTSGNHMIGLLNDILDISKNEYGHSIAHERVDYEMLSTEAIRGLRSLALNNGIKFNGEIAPASPDASVILTDKTKVIQIVSNIINNAIKFSPAGSIDVGIQLRDTIQEAVEAWDNDSAKHDGAIFTIQEQPIFTSTDEVKKYVADLPSPPNQKWMLVAVTDSGCGMRPDELSEMLKPYTQSSSGTNKSFQGTGLGLFICLSLCHQLNGFIACSSTKGVGSTFHVGIPVGIPIGNCPIKTIVDVVAPARPDSPVSDVESTIGISDTIAVVDDNKVNVKILVRSLTVECKKAGIEVEIIKAEGGQEAFDLFKERKPRLMFIDYHMPGTDGLQATEMIRQYEIDNKLVPSFIMSYTADATEKTAKLLLSRGTNQIMTKPTSRGFLSNVVKRIVKEE